MASGHAAVLAANNPGYASVITRDDMLFEPAQPAELAGLLAEYVADPAKRQTAADWGTAHAKSFDVATVGKELVTRYEHIYTLKHQG
jgi:hypothetical protein